MNWSKRNLEVNWHPYTQMKDCEKDPPVVLKKATGLKLIDEHDHYYYDTVSSWWCNILGHSHPNITEAIQRQLNDFGHVMFGGFTHKPAIELSETLIEITPKPISRVFYSDNGSTAIEVALKMSIQYWQHIGKKKKNKFISFNGAYHGDTIGAMSVSGTDLFHATFQALCFENFKTPIASITDENYEESEAKAIAAFKTLVKTHHQDIAGFVFEPLLMGAGGMIHTKPSFLNTLTTICNEHEIHTIADEIATGFGRTGTLFACEQASIEPDFLCLSKALTNGTLPLAVTCTTDTIYQAFYADYNEHKTFYHGHTFTANALGCAVANETLNIIKQENIINHAKTIESILSKNRHLLTDITIVHQIRVKGSTLAFELCNPTTGKTFPDHVRLGYELFKIGKKHHVILRPLGNTAYLYLPLVCTEKDILIILDHMKTSLIELEHYLKLNDVL